MTIKNNAAHLQLSAKVLLRFSGVIEHEDGFEASERKGEKCLFLGDFTYHLRLNRYSMALIITETTLANPFFLVVSLSLFFFPWPHGPVGFFLKIT